ncbi:MAG: hypothetical protein HC911_18180 [Chloroflexaceae bacterium]|nr:hypothetical protein [Chloroflexaceae bacterium]
MTQRAKNVFPPLDEALALLPDAERRAYTDALARSDFKAAWHIVGDGSEWHRITLRGEVRDARARWLVARKP